jgi:hypothetical protein
MNREAMIFRVANYEQRTGGEIVKKAAFLLLCGVLMTGVLYAQDAPVKEVTGGDDLVQEKGPWQGTWVHPDADISKYSKLYLWDAVFQFREGGATSAGTTMQMMRGDSSGPYAVTEDSKEKFKKVVTEAVDKELARGKMFEVTDTVGPGTLLVRTAVLDIVSDVPPHLSGGGIHLASVGQATMVFELIDAETGVIQARVAERRAIQPDVRMNQVNAAPTNSATVWADVERWARDEAQALRKELEKAKKKAE